MRTGAQLRHIFYKTFDGLPAAVRAKIEAFWTLRQVDRLADGRFSPFIFQPAALGKPVAGKMVEIASLVGLTDNAAFCFKKKFVDEAPDEILQTAIAHELAHVYRAAEAFPITPVPGTAEENAVGVLLEGWDFDHDVLISWCVENASRLL